MATSSPAGTRDATRWRAWSSLLSLGLAAAVVLAQTPADPDTDVTVIEVSTAAAPASVTRIAPAPTVTGASAPVAPRYGSVTSHRLALRVDGITDVTPMVELARATPGVVHAAGVRVATVPVGTRTLTVASVNPVSYRPFAPQVVVDAVGVWERLDDGEVALTHERAAGLGVDLAGRLGFGVDGSHAVRVGALASNGTPPIADALVDETTGRRLGIDAVPATLLVAVADGSDPDEVAARLEERIGAPASVLPDPRAPRTVVPGPMQGDTVWDRLAACESSGDWSANTGNGYYGGLQFLPESWWTVGGSGLPHEASREEQIARAEALLDLQGWVAWPACSVALGLR